MQGNHLVEEVPGLEVPSRGAGVVADNSDRTRIVPTKRHQNAAFEFYWGLRRLHVLSDMLHKRAIVGNPYVGHEQPHQPPVLSVNSATICARSPLYSAGRRFSLLDPKY
jgi:hypothetical protein